jgi:hypothetical protein
MSCTNVKKVVVNKQIDDSKTKCWEGKHFNKSHYDKIYFKGNVDCYWIDSEGKEKILFKIRRNVIPINISKKVYDIYIKHVNKTKKNNDTKFIESKNTDIMIGNKIFRNERSRITGFYDRGYVKLNKNFNTNNICRKTAFTRDNWDLWEKVIPFFNIISKYYKNLAPIHYKKQLNLFKKCPPGFQIGKTPFTTITSNYNWRTACHVDKGDFKEGMGNLTVLGGNFEGCYLGFPQFKVAVSINPKDTLIMDVHQWHCNTESNFNNTNKTRLSFVSYFREKMVNCNKKKIINGEIYYYKKI